MIDSEILLGLAPLTVRNFRSERYDGGGNHILMRDFTLEDVSIVLQVYRTVKRIYDLWLYMKDDPNYSLFENEIRMLSTPEFLNLVRSMGADTYSKGNPGDIMRMVVHDIRGGALSALIGYSARLLEKGLDNESTKMMIFFARDHAKMMRNAILDIDTPVRLADESAKVHHIRDFVQKWNGANFKIGESEVLVRASSEFDGYITNRCLETSAIDRILYNYMNNAARFTADKMVELNIIKISDKVVRWIVSNKITVDQSDWLTKATDNDLNKLFSGGITRNGHGIGLSSCAGFVGESFGIRSVSDSLSKGLLGAKVENLTYHAWFHWPIVE